MYPHLALQLIFTLILLTLPASHTSDNNDQFSTCSSLYSCGENIQGVGYPFWGDHRPQICGLQGFELTCSQDNSFPTINMNTQTFSVLSIQESRHQMTLAHLDVDGKLCKQGSLYNTDLNDALFAYNHDDVGFVNVYYNCPSGIDTNSSSYSEVKQCSENGLNTNSILTLDVVPGLERCTFNITVPVLKSAILELKSNISMELGSVKRGIPHLMKLKDVFKQGFSVDYKIDEAYCSACENSSGLCWSGTDEAQKTCLCKDGANASVCTTVNKELKRTAAELCAKVEKLKAKRVEETECIIRMERMHISNGYLFRMKHANGGGFNISPMKPRNGRPRTQVQHLMQIDLKGWGMGYVSSFQQHCLLQMLNSVAGLREYFSQIDERNAPPRIPVMVNMASASVPPSNILALQLFFV